MPSSVLVKIKSAHKYSNWLFLRIAFVLAALFLLNAGIMNLITGKDCGNYRLDTVVALQDNTELRLEIAADDTARAKGLSSRNCIPNGIGMLFSFEQLGNYKFWMKDMRFPIDIIWINADQKIVTIASKVSPDSYPRLFSSSSPAKYVLEIGAGQSDALGLQVGSQFNF